MYECQSTTQRCIVGFTLRSGAVQFRIYDNFPYQKQRYISYIYTYTYTCRWTYTDIYIDMPTFGSLHLSLWNFLGVGADATAAIILVQLSFKFILRTECTYVCVCVYRRYYNVPEITCVNWACVPEKGCVKVPFERIKYPNSQWAIMNNFTFLYRAVRRITWIAPSCRHLNMDFGSDAIEDAIGWHIQRSDNWILRNELAMFNTHLVNTSTGITVKKTYCILENSSCHVWRTTFTSIDWRKRWFLVKHCCKE